jgi:hypothetical protein
MTHLDERILRALSTVPTAASDFDAEKYRLAFAPSARAKAQSVLTLLRQPTSNPFSHLRPVFLSIGGADGEEVLTLLAETSAPLGVLLEASSTLAAYASSRQKPEGKVLSVVQGDASLTILRGVEQAFDFILAGHADYLVVTCHAVIHELFDRAESFDPQGFFGAIFARRDIPVWFTYREPGIPEKWPEAVYLRADCAPESLLQIAIAIVNRHATLGGLQPAPAVIGDHVRLNRALAVETIVKLFYLDDITYELAERSTAVDHQAMNNYLWFAIGQSALNNNAAAISTRSAPSESFLTLWQEYKIEVLTADISGKRSQLPILESHTRLIAWRQPPTDINPISDGSADLAIAEEALVQRDEELLTTLLVSRGRSWIERRQRARSLELLSRIKGVVSPGSLSGLFSDYLIKISALFGDPTAVEHAFPPDLDQLAAPYGLDLLFRAERMEIARKNNYHQVALDIANSLIGALDTISAVRAEDSNLSRYIEGTSLFLLANFLRFGGLYQRSLEIIKLAEAHFRGGVESHATELAHCQYARSVCYAVQGLADFGPAPVPVQHFAAGLIQLTYANSAWFINDITSAITHAEKAEEAFHLMAAEKYVRRAKITAALLKLWRGLSEGRSPLSYQQLGSEFAEGLRVITGESDDMAFAAHWISTLRPSLAVGLLQFLEFRKSAAPETIVALPPLLHSRDSGELELRLDLKANSLASADEQLRAAIGTVPGRRIPLFPD